MAPKNKPIAPPVPANKQIAINPNDKFTLIISGETLGILLNVLQELPGKICNPLTKDFEGQVLKQLQDKEKLIHAKP